MPQSVDSSAQGSTNALLIDMVINNHLSETEAAVAALVSSKWCFIKYTIIQTVKQICKNKQMFS